MKILFTTDGDNLESKISKRFGEANYYLIYDTDSRSVDVRENTGHDDDHSSLIELTKEGVTHFVVGNAGPNAFRVLKENGAKLFLARKLTATEAFEKFIKNELEELFEPTLKRPIRKH
ncbi:hypothetical protein MNBD_IGNAVI01-676 [hydrothermal vent metagenome]|uniref:Dinitrogenase iron-molybdenum cofactor biosynthesis domain-containing protein n=1 Tax=hydrothermal vent metagenome TaxID=652676 RepID=A0A3B1CK54_9ZZZZ